MCIADRMWEQHESVQRSRNYLARSVWKQQQRQRGDGKIPPIVSTDQSVEESQELTEKRGDDDEPLSPRRRSSVDGSEEKHALRKRSIDETDQDQPTTPKTTTDEAQPETEAPTQPTKKRKSTSSEDEASTGVVTALPLTNAPLLPGVNGFFHLPSPTPFFPMFPIVMPNQFPNYGATDFELCTSSTSVNIERPTNEIFEASEPGYFQRL